MTYDPKLPWVLDTHEPGFPCIVNDGEDYVIQTGPCIDDQVYDLRAIPFIVHRVNAHDELVACLESIRDLSIESSIGYPGEDEVNRWARHVANIRLLAHGSLERLK